MIDGVALQQAQVSIHRLSMGKWPAEDYLLACQDKGNQGPLPPVQGLRS